MSDTATQAWTLGGGVVGGAVGYLLGGGRLLWTALGALAGALVAAPAADAAAALLPTPSSAPGGSGRMVAVQMVPGQTLIERAQVGDTLIVTAPSGWGVPSATSNTPGFLTIQSTDPAAESTTYVVAAGGGGQIQMQSAGETAVVTVDVAS